MKILIIRDKTYSFNGGIKRHCDDLYTLMFGYNKLDIIPVKDLPCKYVKWIRKYKYNIKQLADYIAKSECDVVHVHGFMSIGTVQAINTAYQLNKKIVYSPHFHPFKYLQNPNLGRLWFYLFLKPILYKVNTIVTINNEDTYFFERFHYNVKRIPHWYSRKVENSHVEKEANMILFIGRNSQNKGIEHLYRLSDKYQIHCICNSSMVRDNFIFYNNITDDKLVQLYKRACVVVIPSRYEAFSLVALEALEYHVPIVISERVRIGDYLKGNEGYRIFEYHDYAGFEKAVAELIVSGALVDYNLLLKPFNKEIIQEEYYQIYID